MFCDGCFVLTPSHGESRSGRPKVWGWLGAAIALAVAGAGVATAESAWDDQWLHREAISGMSVLGAVYCVGALAAFAGRGWWYCDHTGFRAGYSLDLARGMGLVALVPVVAHAAVWLLAFWGAVGVSTLELTWTYWGALASIAGFVTVGVIGCGACMRGGMVDNAMKALAAKHPAGAVSVSCLGRMVTFSVAGFLWWNIVVAPGMYGNEQARQYLVERMVDFGEGEGIELRTTFVAPATKVYPTPAEERYFVFCGGVAGGGCGDEERRGARGGLRRDRRWKICDSASEGFLQAIVFASGSPFPIFPPHRIAASNACEPALETELLVDGGFAHNVPIEAASLVGAQRVLVVESSPGGMERQGAMQEVWHFPLLRNLPRLVPFLYERAQASDALREEGLFCCEDSAIGRRWMAEVVGILPPQC